MKIYNNGQRKGMMYGGMASAPKKKMNMGGLADQNRKTTTGSSAMMNPMGSMTEKKKFSMGMMAGGMAKKKKKMSYNDGGLVGKQAKLDMNKDGKISGKDFKMMS
jgi:hypothetical protein